MKLKLHILLLLCFLIVSCTPSVRFASNKLPSKESSRKSREISDIKYPNLPNKELAIPKIDYSEYNLNALQNDLISESEKWLGTPYRYGGVDGNGIDCSAFVQNVYASLGIIIPRTAQDQFDQAKIIDKKVAEPGDLVFFSNGERISHVGIYLGENIIIHASTSKGVIKQSLTSNYWEEKYAATGRLLNL